MTTRRGPMKLHTVAIIVGILEGTRRPRRGTKSACMFGLAPRAYDLFSNTGWVRAQFAKDGVENVEVYH